MRQGRKIFTVALESPSIWFWLIISRRTMTPDAKMIRKMTVTADTVPKKVVVKASITWILRAGGLPDNVALCQGSWGSRPRLWICRRFAARGLRTGGPG